uniref:hypothetical protein n=1 Tax=Actinoplanes rectilineatus TaxID=113571 RepID=UPI000A877B51
LPSWLPCPLPSWLPCPLPSWLPCPLPSWLPCLLPSWLPCLLPGRPVSLSAGVLAGRGDRLPKGKTTAAAQP